MGVTVGTSDGELEDGSRVEVRVGRRVRSDFRFVVIGPISAFSSFQDCHRLVFHVLSRCHILKDDSVNQ